MSTTENDIIFDEMWDEVKDYLDDLRDSGYTNMFGAGRFLQEDMGMDKHTARRYLSTWMAYRTANAEKIKGGDEER